MKTYKQLTQEQRYQISALRKAGFNQSEIANQIEVNKSTVSRELRRNRGKRGYRPKQAHSTAVSRQQSVKKACTFTDDMRLFITEKIQEQWSPEQIHGYCKTEEIAMVSHETIYQFLLADKAKGGQLYVHLRCQRKRYKKRYGKVDTRGCIKNRVSIDERPQVVEKKKRVGDWEGDTVIGKNHQGVIVTLVDRVSKLALIKRVPNKSAEVVTTAIKALLKPYKDHVHTITFDNGKEFAYHEKIAKACNTKVYFAHPYHSWERGLNENTNGLVRQYFPKKSRLDRITDDEVNYVMMQLNTRPRKTLDFKTPIMVFKALSEKPQSVAVAT